MVTDFTRFCAKVDVTATCWEWRGARNTGGYGNFNRNGRYMNAHRAAYEYWLGPVPENLQVDHLCRNRNCVNPRHLEAVTQKENLLRGEGPAAINARKELCGRGHLLVWVSDGRRCVSCRNEWRRGRKERNASYARRWRAAQKEK